MLDHLWTIWRLYRHNHTALYREARVLLVQYSIEADDFAFSLMVSLRDYAMVIP